MNRYERDRSTHHTHETHGRQPATRRPRRLWFLPKESPARVATNTSNASEDHYATRGQLGNIGEEGIRFGRGDQNAFVPDMEPTIPLSPSSSPVRSDRIPTVRLDRRLSARGHSRREFSKKAVALTIAGVSALGLGTGIYFGTRESGRRVPPLAQEQLTILQDMEHEGGIPVTEAAAASTENVALLQNYTPVINDLHTSPAIDRYVGQEMIASTGDTSSFTKQTYTKEQAFAIIAAKVYEDWLALGGKRGGDSDTLLPLVQMTRGWIGHDGDIPDESALQNLSGTTDFLTNLQTYIRNQEHRDRKQLSRISKQGLFAGTTTPQGVTLEQARKLAHQAAGLSTTFMSPMHVIDQLKYQGPKPQNASATQYDGTFNALLASYKAGRKLLQKIPLADDSETGVYPDGSAIFDPFAQNSLNNAIEAFLSQMADMENHTPAPDGKSIALLRKETPIQEAQKPDTFIAALFKESGLRAAA